MKLHLYTYTLALITFAAKSPFQSVDIMVIFHWLKESGKFRSEMQYILKILPFKNHFQNLFARRSQAVSILQFILGHAKRRCLLFLNFLNILYLT